MNEKIDWKSLLQDILGEHDCQTGTIHQIDDSETILRLVFQIGVPEVLIEKIAQIPIGKGIAGAAAERRGPVTLCNLQQDLGGVAKPDARLSGVSGSLAVPIFNASRTQILGTLGIGKFVPYDFPEDQIHQLEAQAEVIRQIFENSENRGTH